MPQEINSFVLTVGATANQNGTALYEGVTVLFLAQLAGVDLTLGQQLMVVYLAILGGIGTAGVPSGSIPFIIGVLVTIGVNPALIAIILGVDRILDMCRTTLNVTGDINCRDVRRAFGRLRIVEAARARDCSGRRAVANRGSIKRLKFSNSARYNLRIRLDYNDPHSRHEGRTMVFPLCDDNTDRQRRRSSTTLSSR